MVGYCTNPQVYTISKTWVSRYIFFAYEGNYTRGYLWQDFIIKINNNKSVFERTKKDGPNGFKHNFEIFSVLL
jgi:hypothetical protein